MPLCQHASYTDNKHRILEQQKARYEANKPIFRECQKAYRIKSRVAISARKATEAYKVKRKQQRAAHKHKEAAHHAIFHAIEAGRIARPKTCECCHEQPERPVHGHHEDYSKPLDVIWLCAPCHGMVHGGRLSLIEVNADDH